MSILRLTIVDVRETFIDTHTKLIFCLLPDKSVVCSMLCAFITEFIIEIQNCSIHAHTLVLLSLLIVHFQNGVHMGILSAFKLMKNGGVVVNISSTAGLTCIGKNKPFLTFRPVFYSYFSVFRRYECLPCICSKQTRHNCLDENLRGT